MSVSLVVTKKVDPDRARDIALMLSPDHLGRAGRIESRLIAGRGILLRSVDAAVARDYILQAAERGVPLEIRRWRVIDRLGEGPPPRRWTERPIAGVLTLAVILALVGAGWWFVRVITALPRDAGSDWRSATVKPGRIVPAHRPAAADAADDRSSMPPSPPAFDEVFDPRVLARVRDAVVRIEVADGVGTGFFVSPSGLIVTNDHVIGDNRSIDVHAGVRHARARLVRSAPAWDLALLRVPLEPRAWLPLADGARVKEGALVFTVGSAEGLDGSVRRGRVSKVGRTLNATAHLEIDVAVAPGHSGGPLVDGRGRVVGIVNAFLSTSSRTSYAIMSNYLFDGPDALLRGYAPVFPLSETFLRLQLESLADIGPELPGRRAMINSQAFLTEGGVLAVVAMGVESDLRVEEPRVPAHVLVRATEKGLLWEGDVEARVSARSVGRRVGAGVSYAPSISFAKQLSPAVYDAVVEAGKVWVDVSSEAVRVERRLELSL